MMLPENKRWQFAVEEIGVCYTRKVKSIPVAPVQRASGYIS